MKISKSLVAITLSIFLSGCAKDMRVHGFNFEHTDFKSIKVGETTRHQVLSELGSPTSESDFGEKKYYYIYSKVEKIAFLDPKIVEQKVLSIGFDDCDTVKDINELTLDDANKIIFSESRTEIKGNSLTAVQQILTNIGKYNKKK
jgi:outer membrane protein assembly factor BamE (lipoprotein component of BamABCDE complex)